MDAGSQHRRTFALAQDTRRNHQLQQLLGIVRVDNVQDLAQQLLLVGKELDLHLIEIVLVMLGARELRDPAVQIRCGAHNWHKLGARCSRVAKQRDGQIQINQIAMVDLQKAQTDGNRIARSLIRHAAIRAKVISLQGRRIKVHMMICRERERGKGF